MTKNEYLKMLKRALRPIKTEERKKSLAYFDELIDDRMEEGVSEEDAVSGLENVDAAAERIIAEAKAQGQMKPRHSAWEIVLLVLGFPVWFPLLLAVAVVVLTVYTLGWVLIGVLFILSASLALGGVAAVFGMFFALSFASAFACLGVGLISAGLGTALFIPALYFARSYARVTPVMWRKLTNMKGGSDSYE